MVEWCNSFVLITKPNGKVRLYLNLVRLNQALITPVNRGPIVIILHDIFPKLDNVKYVSFIDTSSSYHNLKLGERFHILQHLHANLAGTDTKYCYSEQPLQDICSNEKLTKYLKIYQIYLVLQMTFWL